MVQSAASDWAATRLAIAIERVAEALLVEEEAQRTRAGARAAAPTSVIRDVYSYNCDW